MLDEGQILYAPMYSGITYLKDYNGNINHTWTSNFWPGVMVRWLGDGTIFRTIRVGVGPGGGGAGGGVQKVLWDGTVAWDFRYNINGCLTHHDLKILPNGNVLLIAWETKTRNECIAAGRNPSLVTNQGLMPDHIIEVKPTGPSSGEIVWQWHVWDHLIQDYDPSKANYGVVEDHPELVDINFVTSTQMDLMHTNSIDYNPELDQILISVRYYSEIWIIDHSTTTEEAAGHTGGKSGKGGDLLYRWGNPRAYKRGTSSDRKLFEQHDATWIKKGYPGEGNILIFNNGIGRGYSTVDEITPPIDENGQYYIAPGSAFGPSTYTWRYNPQPSFYASHLSGATRLKNGNTLICNGETTKVFEVTPEGSIVWQQTLGGGQILKIDYIPPEEPQPPQPGIPDLDCSGFLSWINVKPGATVNGTFTVQNIGDNDTLLNWSINISSIDWGIWSFNPESGKNLTPEDGKITVQVSVVAPDQKNSEFDAYIKVENDDNPDDFDLIPVVLKTPKTVHANSIIKNNFFLVFRNIFSKHFEFYLKNLNWLKQ
ncbi:MAG: aryl-sulfate sulfotransferase [Thermoplasmatota archaeon]